MTDLKITGINAGQAMTPGVSGAKEAGKGFDDLMQDAIGKISQVQNDADKAVKELASGGDPAEAIIAMEKADMNFQMMVEVRNKLISAYEEIMRMQV